MEDGVVGGGRERTMFLGDGAWGGQRGWAFVTHKFGRVQCRNKCSWIQLTAGDSEKKKAKKSTEEAQRVTKKTIVKSSKKKAGIGESSQAKHQAYFSHSLFLITTHLYIILWAPTKLARGTQFLTPVPGLPRSQVFVGSSFLQYGESSSPILKLV